MINDAAVLDTRKLMTGKDGRLFVEFDGKQTFLAEVDQFAVNMNVTNVDSQPVGSILVFAVPSGVSFSLSLSEMVVRDDLIMEPLVEAVRSGKIPTFNFQGGAERWDGQEQRMTFRNCTPDGEFNLLNLTPGEIIKRNQSYRINSVPEWLNKLRYE
jgi:hypothetical protein